MVDGKNATGSLDNIGLQKRKSAWDKAYSKATGKILKGKRIYVMSLKEANLLVLPWQKLGEFNCVRYFDL
jgi:hypothetical protein